jgi:hypothetical protein
MKWLVLAVLGIASTPASAEVVSSSSNAFHVRHVVQVVMPTQSAYAAFANVGGWWNGEHSYSGDAANLTLATSAGGCFCERVPKTGGSVEHMRVAYVEPGARLVMTGSLGPLLFEATAGVMDVKVERIAGGSRVTLDYKVAGFADGNAAVLAPLVDSVLGDQMKRYRAFAVGRPRN